jgi:arylsulfatase
MDIMPTILEFANVKYPTKYKGNRILPLEGRSLMPVLRGWEYVGHDALYWEHEGNRAVRQGDWKLVSRFNYKANESYPWELYNLYEDRTETNDLSGKYPERVGDMIGLYESWMARCQVVRFAEIRKARHPERY